MRFLTAGTLSILILATLVGLVAAYGVRSLLVPRDALEDQPPATNNVPVVSGNLPSGRMVRLGDISLLPMTNKELNNQGWPLHEVMLSTQQIIGRTLKKSLSPGNPFLTSDFYLEGEGPSYLSQLKPGFRAVSIVVPLDRGGYVTPGAYVDVLFRVAPRVGNEIVAAIPETTVTLIEGVEVLAVERPRSAGNQPTGGVDLRNSQIPDRAPPPTIILAVSSEQATRLQTVDGRGELALAARPKGEVGVATRPSPLTLEDLLGIEPPLPPAPPPEPGMTEVYRGAARSVHAFAPRGDGFVPVNFQPGQSQ